MERGNVLVIGNSGVGKSTLINAVLGKDAAMTGWGTRGTTTKLEIFESEKIPFRIIDSIGFEPSFLKRRAAIGAVKRWSEESAKKGKEDTQIDLIWFCVDGTARKLFPEAIQSLSKATAMWKSVPIIVVITKSFSMIDRKSNIDMVYDAFKQDKHCVKNLRKVIPVVADTFYLTETAYAAPQGIDELIDATNEYLPEGIKASDKDIASFKLERRRIFAHGTTLAATAAGAAVGAIPIPVADAAILAPVEMAEVNAIARIYDIGGDDESKALINSLVEAGTAGIAAKTAISAIKSIPGINVAASVINAVVAGSIVFALGEGAIFTFERIYLGEKSLSDTDWAKDAVEAMLSGDFIENVKLAIGKVAEDASAQNIATVVAETFTNSPAKKE